MMIMMTWKQRLACCLRKRSRKVRYVSVYYLFELDLKETVSRYRIFFWTIPCLPSNLNQLFARRLKTRTGCIFLFIYLFLVLKDSPPPRAVPPPLFDDDDDDDLDWFK